MHEYTYFLFSAVGGAEARDDGVVEARFRQQYLVVGDDGNQVTRHRAHSPPSGTTSVLGGDDAVRWQDVINVTQTRCCEFL